MKKKAIMIALLVLLLAAAAAVVVLRTEPEAPKATPAPTESMSLAEVSGIKINSVSSYDGAYYEDGSDENVTGVMKISVSNTGDKDFRLLNLILTDEKGSEYSFELSTFLKGETMTALEKNRTQFASAGKIVSFRLENAAVFEQAPSLYPDRFAFLINGSTIRVMNISDSDYNNISVFYKNYDGDTAVGGITYRLTIDSLAAGQTAELTAGHYDESASRLIFAVYGE